MLATNFRYWQIEGLLHQAEALITRCLRDFRIYCSLDSQWHQFEADLEAQEIKLGLFNQPVTRDIFDREVAAPQSEYISPDVAAEPQEESEIVTLVEAIEAKSEEAPAVKTSLELRTEALQRKRELAAPGRPFALDEQRDLALKRLCRDYEEAVNRACVAEEGLKKLYDQTGVSSPLPSEAETLGTSITNLAIWIRNASEWLAEYHQMEQPFTRAVSVRSLLNRNSWALLKHSRDNYSLKLQVPADLFRGHYNCHLRGIAAALVGEAGTVPWSIILRLPDEALYERAGQSMEVDQSNRATCLLGRVESRRSHRSPEVCGATTLLNASPVGRSTPGGMWSLDIIKPVGATSESFHHLEDVVLEIYAVGIPQKITS
jgi:hypothetical protein